MVSNTTPSAGWIVRSDSYQPLDDKPSNDVKPVADKTVPSDDEPDDEYDDSVLKTPDRPVWDFDASDDAF